MDEGEFLSTNLCMPSIWYFFYCWPERIDVYFSLQSFFESFWLFSHVAYQFGFLVIFSWLPYFAPKLFLLPLHQVVGMSLCHDPYLFVEAFLVGLECPVLSVLRYPVSITFLLSPILSGLFPRVELLFLHVLLFLFVPCSSVFSLVYHFGCRRIFLICFYNRISHTGFEFLFVVLSKTPIFSQTNFAPA